ncbi:hypothetical protein [Sulfuricystis thermophila]|uniref:hypothetical protein n=1 Tax=Sulfuricystis thermophila TaxID=2496847 RepID=UPI0010367C0C|nr:hypothetical protein [Sulfuricystis thermophila]
MGIFQTTGWIPASEAWFNFVRDHPEFGVKPTESSWIHFQRTHAKALIDADVIRRIAWRGRMLADTSRFDTATFNLLTTGSVEGRNRTGSAAPKIDYEGQAKTLHEAGDGLRQLLGGKQPAAQTVEPSHD